MSKSLLGGEESNNMKKTLLYRLFKIGGIPKKLRPVLDSEGIVICDEGIGDYLIMKDFKAPGKRFKHRREGFSGFLAITEKRIISYAYRKPIINIPIGDTTVASIHAEIVSPNRIELSFESSVFHKDRSGSIITRFNTSKAQDFYNIFKKIAQQSTPADARTSRR